LTPNPATLSLALEPYTLYRQTKKPELQSPTLRVLDGST